MKAILLKAHGDSSNLYIGEHPKPNITAKEILVEVKTTALNRADTLQRMGKYPPPPGASEILGLEMAGVVSEVGSEVGRWKVGDRVMGLLAGGGYAQYVGIHEDLAMAIPKNLSFEDAAAIPEVFLTAYQALVDLSNFQAKEKLLIHAGASGVGTAAIQLGKLLGASEIFVTASAAKHDICTSLGADYCIDYKTTLFDEFINEKTEGKGVDTIMDFLMAPYFQKNLDSLAMDGRMVMLATMGGIKTNEINLVNILRRRIRIIGSTLRARTLEYKVKLTQGFSELALDEFAKGNLKPVIDSVYDWSEVGAAHDFMEANKNKGKIILRVS